MTTVSTELTDAECDAFRALPLDFNGMVRAIYAAGAARSADTSGAPDQVIELAEALQVRHILEEIKKVVAIHPAAEMPTPFQAAWQSCCEEIFYRATGCQWHMDEDATRFGREAAPLPEPPPAAPVGARSGEANAEVT